MMQYVFTTVQSDMYIKLLKFCIPITYSKITQLTRAMLYDLQNICMIGPLTHIQFNSIVY